MDDLIAFLRARLDEDEAAAKAVRPDQDYADSAHQERWSPARVLREVAAMRAVVRRYERGAAGELPEWKADRELTEAALAILLGVLRDLAAIWGDHPGYRQEWAPIGLPQAARPPPAPLTPDR